jgi:hypothetical protein
MLPRRAPSLVFTLFAALTIIGSMGCRPRQTESASGVAGVVGTLDNAATAANYTKMLTIMLADDALKGSEEAYRLATKWHTNIAPGKTATQSSNYSDMHTADRAVDGVTMSTTVYAATTYDDDNAWWEVDLGGEEPISVVALWKHGHPQNARYSVEEATVALIAADHKTVVASRKVRPIFNERDVAVGNFEHLLFNDERARYVKVIASARSPLAVAEVEVMKKSLAPGSDVCWKRSQIRKLHVISECSEDQDKDPGGLCYPKCREGFSPVVTRCYENCPAGARDDGLFCWYDGRTHRKESYDRGVGKPLQCSPGQENLAGRCYDPCPPSMQAIDSVCWASCRPETGFPHDCGAACASSPTACGLAVTNMVTAPIFSAISLATFGTAVGGSAAVRTAVQASGKAISREALRAAARQAIRETVQGIPAGVVDTAVEAITSGVPNDELDPSVLANLDPTGLATVVLSFVKPWCDEL